MLSERQAEVIKRLAAGTNVKTIASDMKIGTKTVEFHRAAACRKLGLRSIVDIVHYGVARLGVPLMFALVILALPAKGANLTNLGNVTLGWDRSPDDFLTNGVSYKILASTNANFSGASVAWTGTNTICTLTNIAPAVWYYEAMANQGGIDSDPSNVVVFYVPALKPRPPGKMFMVHLESTLDFTNWSDMGNFRAVLKTWP